MIYRRFCAESHEITELSSKPNNQDRVGTSDSEEMGFGGPVSFALPRGVSPPSLMPRARAHLGFLARAAVNVAVASVVRELRSPSASPSPVNARPLRLG